MESALLDDCSVNEISSICRGKSIPSSLRPDVWQICLDVRHKSDQLSHFNEIFDLPNQAQLREDCNTFVDKLGNEEEEKLAVISDLESILTFYCKSRKLRYESNNGWVELLLPLLSLKLKRSQTYNLFEAIRDTYIPKGCVRRGNVFHVFRLLIQYHDPELCSMLDTKRVTPDLYSISWFQSLFASTCTLPVVLSMWDLYFQQTDPFLVFFLSLIMLINDRDNILAMKDKTKENLCDYLQNMPAALEPDDVVDFCTLAQYYSIKTPSSFKTELLKALFGAQSDANSDAVISQALCLPVSVYELVENAPMESPHPDSVRFFLVDCRHADQYNAGHLSTAFHLDSNLMLQEPIEFATAVSGLLRAQKKALEANSNAGGEHLCFMGSGRLDEDQYTHMVVASFLQKGTQYVSLLTGGYTAIHDYFGEHMADCLEDHDPLKCLMCSNGNQMASVESNNNFMRSTKPPDLKATQKPSVDLFSRFSAAMKTKTNEVKDKLMDIIVNPSAGASTQSSNVIVEKHVSSHEKNGKRYRNVAPVFSIDDDQDDSYLNNDPSTSDESSKEIITLSTYLKNPDIINFFRCQEVHMNGFMHDSHLIVTKTHLIVLRDLQKDTAQLIAKRPLASICKITAKKRHRDLITFKYGIPDEEKLLITDMDRFLIPNASEATAIVSKQIVNQLDNYKSQ